MNNTWFWMAVLGGLGSNLSNFLIRKSQSEKNEENLIWWMASTRVIVAIGVAIFTPLVIDVNGSNIWALLSLSTLEIVAIYFLIKMHTHTQLSVSTILVRLRLLIVPILAFLFFGENISQNKLLAYLVIFLGLTLAKTTATSFKLDRGEKYTLGFVLASSLIAILVKLVGSVANTTTQGLFFGLIPMIFLPTIIPGEFRPTAFWQTKKLEKAILLLVSSLYLYPYIFALTVGPAGQVVAVYQGMMIFGVLAGITQLGETQNWKSKLIGSVVTLIGLYLLAV